MFKNLPVYSDFEQSAKEYLVQAFNLVYEIYNQIESSAVDEQEITDTWKYHQGTLRTSLTLIHQAIELFMKAEVCKTSPFMLLESKPSDWPTLPGSSIKDFTEVFTLGAESLLHVYCALNSRIDHEFVNFINEIRIKRNKIMHGVAKEKIDHKYIIEAILKAFSYFLGKDQWWLTIRELTLNHPLFGFIEHEYETAQMSRKFNFVETVLGKGRLINYLTQNLKSRRYFCPFCKHDAEHDIGEGFEYKLAFLTPNKPDSTNLLCLSCRRNIKSERIDCKSLDCKGNVIFKTDEYFYNEVSENCLTCFKNQNIEDEE